MEIFDHYHTNYKEKIGIILFTILLISLSNCNDKVKDSPNPLAINLTDVEWGEPGDGSIAPKGTRTALQSENPKTGGISYYAWFPAGGFFDEHWHIHMMNTLYLLAVN